MLFALAWLAALHAGPAPADAEPPVEATSLLGRPLVRPTIAPDRLARLEARLAEALRDYQANPDSEDSAIWYGRRLAYLGQYRDAIAAFSVAIERHPRSFKLLRHRGHRHITVREFDRAIADLSRAAELSRDVPDKLEPDGAPNPRNIPRSTDQSNIWYHLALAHYLNGDFAKAAECWGRCMGFSRVNDDMLVATAYWLYLSLRRAGDDDRAGAVLAPIRPDMDIIENHAYHRLMLMFKGDLTEAQVRAGLDEDAIADATVGYGIGMWHLLSNRDAEADSAFDRVLTTENWAAFGYIAAEADRARSGDAMPVAR